MSRIIITLAVCLILVWLAGCAGNCPVAKADAKQPRFVTLKDTPVVGIVRATSFREMKFPQVWEDFFAVYNKTEHGKNDIFYGISFWDASAECGPDMPLNYLVGVPEAVLPDASKQFSRHVIKGGEYVVFTHVGTLDKMPLTFDYIYSKWFPKSGYESRPGEEIEYYDSRFKDNAPDSVVEIWIPVQKKP